MSELKEQDKSVQEEKLDVYQQAESEEYDNYEDSDDYDDYLDDELNDTDMWDNATGGN
jgi:RIO kinase 1